MAIRIAGVNLPENKRIVISLTYLKGIGLTLAEKILKDMLSRQRRVSRRQFSPALKQSRLWQSSVLSLRLSLLLPREAVKSTSFAFVVSRKVAAKAVDRNKLKRRARTIARELLPRIKDNYTCLLFFKKEATSLSYQELKKAIYDLLHLSSIIF